MKKQLLIGRSYYQLFKIYSIKDSTIFQPKFIYVLSKKGVSIGHATSCIKPANQLVKEGCSKKDIKETIEALNKTLLHEENDLYFTKQKKK